MHRTDPDTTRATLRLSAVIPIFNERQNLTPLTEELVAELQALGSAYEIVLVDDGSTDGSTDLVDALARRFPSVRALHLDRNRGQSAALAAGFAAAQGEYVVTMDGDLQNDPADISRLMEWIPQADMVVGYRGKRQDTWVRRMSSTIANRVRSAVLKDGILDTGCSLKLIRRDLVRAIPPLNGMHRFLPVFAQMQGAVVRQLPVNHRPRVAGKSKYNVNNRLFRGVLDLVGMWWFKRRYVPFAVSYEAPGAPRGVSPTEVEESES